MGSGLSRIIEASRRQGLKTPLIEEHNNRFSLTLYSTQVEEIAIESWGKMILRYLKSEDSITTKAAAKMWKTSIRTARTRLKQLEEDGFILRLATSTNDPNVIYISTRKAT